MVAKSHSLQYLNNQKSNTIANCNTQYFTIPLCFSTLYTVYINLNTILIGFLGVVKGHENTLVTKYLKWKRL